MGHYCEIRVLAGRLLKTYFKGMPQSVRGFLSTHPNLELDKSRERYLFTKYHGGFLKRVR